MKKIIFVLSLVAVPAFAVPPNQGNPTYGSMTLQTPLPLASGGVGAANAAGARANLGLGGAATLNVGTVSGTVADGGSLTTETSRAQAAESTNATAINSETSRAEAEEALKASLASPTFTGSPSLPTGTTGITQAPGTSTTTLATTAFDTAAVGVETARATAVEALKAPLASPGLTGTPTAPTATPLTSNGQIATTGYADAAVAVEKERAQGAEALAMPLSEINVANGVAGTDVNNTISAQTATTTNGTANRSLSSHFNDILNVNDFGAKGDCHTDDSAAFNAYSSYLRAQASSGYLQNMVFQLAHGQCYLIENSINLAGFDPLGSSLNTAWPAYGGQLLFDGNGSLIVANGLGGKAILDAVDSLITFKNLNILSSVSAPASESLTAIQAGRAVLANAGGSPVTFDNVVIDGYYSLATVHIRAAEVSTDLNSSFFNRDTNNTSSTVLMLDGVAKYPFVSSFYTDKITYPTAMSFQSFKVIGGRIVNLGTGSGIWASNLLQPKFDNTYVNVSSATEPDVVLWFENGIGATSLFDYDVHQENKPTNDFLLTGNATSATINSFLYHNSLEQATASVFAVGGSLTSVVIHNLDLSLGGFASFAANTPIFDHSSGTYTVDGKYYVPTVGNWNLTSGFTGLSNIGGVVTYSGSLAASVALPSTINVSAVAAAGSVASINVVNGGAYRALPTVQIASPPVGGSQATAVVASAQLFGIPVLGFVSAGSGYTNGDIVTVALPGGCAAPFRLALTVVSGAVTGISNSNSPGVCPATVWTGGTLATTGGTGTGLTIDDTGGSNSLIWSIPTGAASVQITGGGGGYLTLPAVTFSTAGTQATGNASLTSSLSLNSGAGQILLNSLGTQLGINGTGGSPVINKGAQIDGSGVRVALTTSGYTVPLNTSLVRFTQTGTIASSTITLPTAFADGQPIQFVNYAGAVTALTFSPSVNGWTNGSALTANTGVRIRWDATAAAWYREQ